MMGTKKSLSGEGIYVVVELIEEHQKERYIVQVPSLCRFIVSSGLIT